jgi:hypothetical protein
MSIYKKYYLKNKNARTPNTTTKKKIVLKPISNNGKRKGFKNLNKKINAIITSIDIISFSFYLNKYKQKNP